MRIVNSSKDFLTSRNVVKKNELVGNGDRSNDSSQNWSKSKKFTNLAKPRKAKNYLKLSKFKKTIFNKLEILVNLTMADTTGYLITKTRVTFTCLRQAFTKTLII